MSRCTGRSRMKYGLNTPFPPPPPARHGTRGRSQQRRGGVLPTGRASLRTSLIHRVYFSRRFGDIQRKVHATRYIRQTCVCPQKAVQLNCTQSLLYHHTPRIDALLVAQPINSSASHSCNSRLCDSWRTRVSEPRPETEFQS